MEEDKNLARKTKDATKKAIKAAARTGRVASVLIAIVYNPITWGVLGLLALMLAGIAGGEVVGQSDFAMGCTGGTGGSTSLDGIIIDTSEPGYLSRKDAENNAKVIAGRLSGVPLKANGNKPLNRGQVAAIIGNMYAESTLNPSLVQKGYYASQAGIGNNATNEQIKSLNGKHESAVGLVQMTNGRMLTMVKKAESLNTTWNDPEAQIQFIFDEIEGIGDTYQNSRLKVGDFFNQDKTVDEYTAIWNAYYERSGDCVVGMCANGARGPEFRGGGKKRLDFAKWTFDSASSWGTGDGSGTQSFVSQCGGSDSGVNGLDMSDTVKLAISMAYPASEYSKSKVSGIDKFGKSNAKPEYIQAKSTAEASGGKDPMPGLYASCDRFVATVLKATKADTAFPWGATSQQYNYMKSSPKWKEVKCGERQPGDVIITRGDGHIMLYLGKVNGMESLASASYLDRVGAVGSMVSCSGDSWNGDGWSDIAGFRLVK